MKTKIRLSHRILSVFLCMVLLLSTFPMLAFAAESESYIKTIADPETLTRPETIYGDSTVNSGKITVGKSVSTKDVTVNGQKITLDGENNFLITISQSAQVMGLTSKSNVPVDVVFVLDTSGSMAENNRAATMVTAANAAINTLMSTNEQNRIAVVAFSSEDYGGGTSDGAAANVLSSLAHYEGNAATNHLRWVNSNGTAGNSDNDYIAGRNTVYLNNLSVNAYRNGKNGGTNIQAGIAEGAKILTSVTNTVYIDPVTNEAITRIPFIIVLSDGQPTYTYDDDDWYDPQGANEQGPGSSSYEGNGFIAALTAAYYKGKITEHYYGEKANNENHCFIYTMGVEINELSGDDKNLAGITLDPKTYTSGEYATNSANSYWNYGNTANDNTKNSDYGWKKYWEYYTAASAQDFGVRVDSDGGIWVWSGNGTKENYYELEEPNEPQKPQEPGRWASQAQWNRYYTLLERYNTDMQQYTIDKAEYDEWLEWRNKNFTYISGEHYILTAASIAATKKYVNGIGYTGGIAYNDDYFGADKVSDLQENFEKIVRTIQQKAISVPTKVTTGDHNFDGYVTFTDPIGEYMEVKDMKGIVANCYFYQGASFAEKLSRYGTANADTEFDSLILDVIKTRMHLTSSTVNIEEFISKMKASANQAYYNNANDYDNSLVWWGNAYDSGEEDEQVQVLGFADNDTIEYIESQKTAGTIPAGADYVCRSYFFYGEAGGANLNPDHEYLYFMVRVQREITAPYKETVVISAPASLLSLEKVLIEETFDRNGDPVYTATVKHMEPARVVYEVGLWDTITPENVSYIVSKDYKSETVNGGGTVNYDAATDTYNFFTNDWDRSQSLASHHRAQAKATFDAAADNAFYTYQEDTLIVDAGGNPVVSNPKNTTAYYVREYYEWNNDSKVDGSYTASKKSMLIKVDIPDNAVLTEKDGKWYIPKGTYTAATLIVNGDDTMKDDPATAQNNDGNLTGTSSIVAHPHRTGDYDNSHYTVFLGNNGLLSLKADPYEPTKTVSVNLPQSATNIVDNEGKPVKVGDILTYTVEVKNVLTEPADITVSDYVPLGTTFIDGSAGYGNTAIGHTKDATIKPDNNNIIIWTLKGVPAGETRYVSFEVVVNEAVLSLAAVPGSIDNTATVQLGNTAAVTTNTTHNPPFGKSVTDVNNQNIDGKGGFKVGDTLVYHIRFQNSAKNANGEFVTADVTVTDTLPAGTSFVSADNGGSYNSSTGVVTWNFKDMEANSAKTVSLTVKINASAKINETGTQPETGEIYIRNTADIVIKNDNNITVTTNTTENRADVGNMVITKTVAAGGDTTKAFTLILTESTGLLNGTYVLDRGTFSETVRFVNGKASVVINHGDTLTVKGLPAGAIISVEEDLTATPGFAPTYNTQSVTIAKGDITPVTPVNITNTYSLQPLTLVLKGVKDLIGTLPQDTVFGFIAEPDSNNPIVGDPLSGEVTVKAEGKYEFDFSSKTFTTPGVYKYTIYEINGGVESVTYDNTNYVLIITVSDNGDGTMSAEATLNGNAFDFANGAVTFTNEYDPYIVPNDVPIQIEADKTLSGRPLKDKEFSFVVRKNNVNGTIVATGNNDVNGKIKFSTFDITVNDMAGEREKTFTYVVAESNNNVPGVTVDDTVFTVTVTVTDDGLGNLHAVVNYPNNAIVFRNTYKPASTNLSLAAFKNLTGKNLAENEFAFELKDSTGSVIQTKYNNKNGAVRFDDLIFTAEDMVDSSGNKVMTKQFVYTVSERSGNTVGMKYDTNVFTVTVTVTDDANGNLHALATYTDNSGDVAVINFNNSYTPTPVEVELEGTKTIVDPEGKVLTGGNYPLGGFEFEVYDTEGAFVTTAVSGADGKIRFTGFEFKTAGEYRFLISEKNTLKEGYTTDPTVWCVHITIMYNADTGVLYEAGEYIHIAPESHDDISYMSSAALNFVNVYSPADVDVTLKVKKELSGRVLHDNEFTFYVVDSATGLLVAQARNTANGEISFHLPYTEAKDYAYTIYEVIPTGSAKLGGMTYSTERYNVNVSVIDDGSGKLKAKVGNITVVGSGSVDMTDSVVFHNSYKAASVDVTIEAAKILEGKELKADKYTFELVDTKNPNKKYTATNTADGTVKFDAITFTEAGEYIYTLGEVKGNESGVTYDDHVYTVTINVTDDGNGKLHAVVHYKNSDGGNEAAPIFYNTYKPAPTDYTPEIKKIYEGGNMLTFDFVLSGNGFDTQIKQNNANGNVTFDKLVFEHAGKYTFTIKEQADVNVDDIRWDTNVYTMVIEVTDNKNGNLEVSDISITSDTGRKDLVFRNVHKELITDKDVYINNSPSASIDGKAVEKGDVLTYTISYTNYTGKPGSVTITDTIPEYTEYVEGSADNNGTYSNGVLTWNITNIDSDDTVTVSFSVKVTGSANKVENKATIVEGTNTYETNTVTNTIDEDEVSKDVFLESAPTVSIDGEAVKKGDVLLYKVTYTNSDDFAADVTITDTIPEYTTYVENSADNGGVYAGGKLTWNLTLAPNESKTVTFKVEVTGSNVTIVNTATALEGSNGLDTNAVSNPVSEEKPAPEPSSPQTGDTFDLHLWVALLFVSGGGLIGTAFYGLKKFSKKTK